MSDEPGVERYRIAEDYSYARERLKSHMSMPSGAQKTLEVLDDVVRVIDEYCSYSDDRTIGPFNFVELTQYLAESAPRGLSQVVAAQRETKMMAPILAGLRKTVLIRDCGVSADDIPDDVDEVFALRGPKEVDDVVAYLSAAGLPSAPDPARKSDVQQTRGGCFVATAVFGGYDAPEVLTLRRFRDERLSKSRGGRWFIRSYYSVGPHLASAVIGKPRVKRVLRVALGMAVRSIARRQR